MSEQARTPKEILERARVTRDEVLERKKAEERRTLEVGLARVAELRRILPNEHDQLKELGEFDTAIQGAESDIAAAGDEKIPELEQALAELRAGRAQLESSYNATRAELNALIEHPDIQSHLREEEQKELKNREHGKKVRELAEFEKDMNEVLRVEQEINTLGRELTDLWKEDNRWALQFMGEASKESYVEQFNTLSGELNMIEQEKAKLAELEGKWFKSKERKPLEAHIAQEPEIRERQNEMTGRYKEIREKHDRLLQSLVEKIAEIDKAVKKIQRIAQEKFNSRADREAPYGGGPRKQWFGNEARMGREPLSTAELIKQRFPFFWNARPEPNANDVNLEKLFKHFGYNR